MRKRVGFVICFRERETYLFINISFDGTKWDGILMGKKEGGDVNGI